MKLELYYDPVKPETAVWIDGKLTDRGDIYGFLYPVRHCLLQTWLYPSGSWSGLARQLTELCRGEALDLVFTGRTEDFQDLRDALQNMEQLTLTHRPTDPSGKYEALFSQMDGQIAHLLDTDGDPGEKKTLRDLFPETLEAVKAAANESGPEWMRLIETEADYLQADQEQMCCCVVSEAYLDSFEKLRQLNLLTRSLRRGQDMILCRFTDPEKEAEFSHYAAQYGNLRFRFCTAESGVTRLWRKYGSVFDLRCEYTRYQRILEILNRCYGQRESIKSRRTALAVEKKRTVEQTRELEKCKLILNWFARKEPYLTRLNTLVTSGSWNEMQKKEGPTDG